MLKTKFQHVLKSVMHFENYVSTCFEVFDMVFSMPIIIRCTEYDIIRHTDVKQFNCIIPNNKKVSRIIRRINATLSGVS